MRNSHALNMLPCAAAPTSARPEAAVLVVEGSGCKPGSLSRQPLHSSERRAGIVLNQPSPLGAKVVVGSALPILSAIADPKTLLANRDGILARETPNASRGNSPASDATTARNATLRWTSVTGRANAPADGRATTSIAAGETVTSLGRAVSRPETSEFPRLYAEPNDESTSYTEKLNGSTQEPGSQHSPGWVVFASGCAAVSYTAAHAHLPGVPHSMFIASANSPSVSVLPQHDSSIHRSTNRKNRSAGDRLRAILARAAMVRPLTESEISFMANFEASQVGSTSHPIAREGIPRANPTVEPTDQPDDCPPGRPPGPPRRTGTGGADESGGQSLSYLLNAFERHLATEDMSLKQRRAVIGHVHTAIDGLKIRTLADFGNDCQQRLKEFLATATYQTTATLPRTKSYSACTRNKILAAFRRFVLFLIKNKQCQITDPTEGIRQRSEKNDRRKVRRHLTPAEEQQLLAAANSGKSIHRRTGYERWMLYKIALGTGFRKAEIASLTVESLRFATNKPTIFLESIHSKNGDEADQPITAELASQITEFVKAKRLNREDHLLPKLESSKTELYIREDLKSAGIPIRTKEGEIDFHALRHTFQQRLRRASIDPKTRQKLMRHRTLNLTLDTYSRVEEDDLRDAIEKAQPPKPAAADKPPEEPPT